MAEREGTLSFPITMSTRGRKGLVYERSIGWMNWIVTRRGVRRCYIKVNHPYHGEMHFWLNLAVTKVGLKWLEAKGPKFRHLTEKERTVMFARVDRDREKKLTDQRGKGRQTW